MYRCERCEEVQPPRTPAVRRVTETRPKTYPFRSQAHRLRIKGKVKTRDDPGGEGREIVREITVCPSCG